MLTEVYSVEVVGGFLSSDRLLFILLLAHSLKNLLAIGKLIALLPTKMGEESKKETRTTRFARSAWFIISSPGFNTPGSSDTGFPPGARAVVEDSLDAWRSARRASERLFPGRRMWLPAAGPSIAGRATCVWPCKSSRSDAG